METSGPATVTPQEQLSELFGSYKAEWLRGRMYELYTEPAYFPELITSRPCILIGGRGTGKTTVLRCMAYEGRFALTGRDPRAIPSWSYYGMYHRVNTNRVTAFRGPELSEDGWIKAFGHYLNIVLCDMVLRLLQWYQLHCEDATQLSADACRAVAATLHLEAVGTTKELADRLRDAQLTFEAAINNVAAQPLPPLSLQGAPVDTLLTFVTQLPQFVGKHLFFLLDEYENYDDPQQRVVNSLIKHSGDIYTFKIGVRELGLRCRTTLNPTEQLVSPADYVRIHIEESLNGDPFTQFALRVCNMRLGHLASSGMAAPEAQQLLPGLTDEEEAERLNSEALDDASAKLTTIARGTPSLSRLEQYFIVFWSEATNTSIASAWDEYVRAPAPWRTRFNNYKHALLFTLRRGKRGIHKYYCGWDTFTRLAASNIRYCLELVDRTLLLHISRGSELTEPVSPEVQTQAAQGVGRKNLAELEGLSVHGAQLTKLLLGLGRVFQVMASDVAAHAPEVNQFRVSLPPPDAVDSLESREPEADKLLNAAVMHLALLRFSGSKLAGETETREYDYMVHPIYAPFFIFSYRRKRRMKVTGRQLLGFINDPGTTIREILREQNRPTEAPLPEQLLLFQAYYESHA